MRRAAMLVVGVVALGLMISCKSGAQRPPVVEEKSLTTLKGTRYAVLVTNERDLHEATEAREVEAADPAAITGAAGDNYKGTSRKAAKTSIARVGNQPAPMETFNDLRALINSLADDDSMFNHNPPITTSSSQDRVQEEKRNVRVRCWLYACSKEDDNDFHLIVGRNPNSSQEMYMTMELSGLPASGHPDRVQLKTARDTFKAFFGNELPGTRYDFYDPPIPMIVEGSLFFDVNHQAGSVGPSPLRNNIPTTWEVHPITDIEFEP